jgi:hypothetical protein
MQTMQSYTLRLFRHAGIALYTLRFVSTCRQCITHMLRFDLHVYLHVTIWFTEQCLWSALQTTIVTISLSVVSLSHTDWVCTGYRDHQYYKVIFIGTVIVRSLSFVSLSQLYGQFTEYQVCQYYCAICMVWSLIDKLMLLRSYSNERVGHIVYVEVNSQ